MSGGDNWHARPAAEVLAAFDSVPSGLSSEQAAERLARHGPKALPASARPHSLRRFFAQFNNALIYFLMAAALGALLLGHRVDAAVIVVVVNALIGFVQEGRAEKALDAIPRMISPRANVLVLRDGRRLGVPVSDLVPGDALPGWR